jgi:hypothetical protein
VRKLGEASLTIVCALPHEPLFSIGGEEATVWGVNKRKFYQLPHEPLFSIGGGEVRANFPMSPSSL